MTTGRQARARLFSLLMACVLFALAGAHVVDAADAVAPAQAATPEAAVRLFYPWYIGEMMMGRVPLTEERMHDYVAKDTLRDIVFAMSFANAGAKASKDYFLQGKDYYDDWADYVTVSELSIDGDAASALVALGDPMLGTRRLALTLVREDGGWKISRVTEAPAAK